MKAVGYVRVSTAGQAAEGISLEAQESRIRAWCQAGGYELISLQSDAGISAKRADNRPGLQAALNTACTEGATLVTYSLSRLARSTRDAISIAERLAKAGADLVSLSEKIDTTSAAGKMVFRMLAVLAEFERDLVAERTSAALAHKRGKGERISRFAPFGWRFNGDKLQRDAREQRAISTAMILAGQGLSLRGIAAELARRGYLNRDGQQISAKVIRDMLHRAA